MPLPPRERRPVPSSKRRPAPPAPRPRGKPASFWLLAVGLPALSVLVGGALVAGLLFPRLAQHAARVAGGATPAFVNPMPLRTYQVTRPDGPTRFRLKARLDTDFNGQYRDCEGTHYSVWLEEEGGADIMHGYAPKDSDVGRRLFEVLKDGKRHVLAVDLEPKGPNGEKTQGNVVAVVGIADAP